MWFRYAMLQTAQSSSPGLGLPGGFHPYHFQLSDHFGGPRWWRYEYDGKVDDFVRNQYRYNPEYLPIGEVLEPKEGDWQELYTLGYDELLGKDIKNIRFYIVPDRHENAELLLHDEEEDVLRVIPIESDDIEDIAKDVKSWNLMVVPDEDAITIYANREISEGKKGIFDVNGRPAAPGFGYIYRDTPSPTPGARAHGDMTENLWDNWRSTITYH